MLKTQMTPHQIVDFYDTILKLKNLKRAGWCRHNIFPCESVAEHTFGVAALALVLCPQLNLDQGKCLALALAHDLAESVVGDITPADNVMPEEKCRRERGAIESIAAELNAPQLVELWQEYERAQTPESQFVRDLDVVEMALQARSYQDHGRLLPPDTGKFIDSAEQRATTPLARQIIAHVKELR